MSMSGYDKATFEAYENMLATRKHAKEELQKIANLLAQNTITYEEAIKRIQFNHKSVNNATWRYKQEITKIYDTSEFFE